MSGCSGASTKKVAPNSVSGLVVNTGVDVELLDVEDDLGALQRPIQFRCIASTRSGQQLEQLHLLEQAVGVRRDAEEPLLVLRFDLEAAALAAPVDDLLVGEHGLVVRAPVDGRFLSVRETRLVELEEEPLGPP